MTEPEIMIAENIILIGKSMFFLDDFLFFILKIVIGVPCTGI